MARKDAEEYIIEMIDMFLPGSINRQNYVNLFASMSDADFKVFMNKIKPGGDGILALISANLAKVRLSIERNLEIAKKIGHNFFKRIWINDGTEVPQYLSPIPYLVFDMVLRRQAQMLVKKISIPEDNKSVDDLTGQPTGRSKGSSLSYPETLVMQAQDLTYSLTEMLKYRGGDVKGFNAMNTAISRTGNVSLKTIEKLGSTVRSTDTLRTFLLGMHLSNTL
jgi:hypothetical protein